MRIRELLVGRPIFEHANDEEIYYQLPAHAYEDVDDPHDYERHPEHPTFPQVYVDWGEGTPEDMSDTAQRWPNAAFATDEERNAPGMSQYSSMMISPEEMPDPRFWSQGGIANDNRPIRPLHVVK